VTGENAGQRACAFHQQIGFADGRGQPADLNHGHFRPPFFALPDGTRRMTGPTVRCKLRPFAGRCHNARAQGERDGTGRGETNGTRVCPTSPFPLRPSRAEREWWRRRDSRRHKLPA
jgi:hypothetical protein